MIVSLGPCVGAFSGFLSGLAGTMTAARAQSGQANMCVAYELDAIAATTILGAFTSGFTFLKVGA